QALGIFILAAYQPNRMIVVAVNGMQRLHGGLRSKVSASGTQVVIVQMPDHGRPGIIQHPLNDTGRLIFIAAIRFVHRPHALVGLELRLQSEVLHLVRFSVTAGQRIAEDMDVLEIFAAGVEVPDLVHRPKMILADHSANTFDGRDSWSHAGFGVKAVSSAAAPWIALFAVRLALRSIFFPIAGSYILIRAGHLNSTVSSDARGLARR